MLRSEDHGRVRVLTLERPEKLNAFCGELSDVLYDADDAVRCGLAWRKVPAGRLMEEALAVAGRIASMPLASLVGTKQLLVAARMERVRAAREREDEMFRRLIGGPANREAVAAFFGKRRPDSADLPPG